MSSAPSTLGIKLTKVAFRLFSKNTFIMKVGKKSHNLPLYNTPTMLETKAILKSSGLGAFSLPNSVMAFQISSSVKTFSRSLASSRLIGGAWLQAI